MSSDENRLELRIPADGNERTVWVTDENGERINFFNIVRYPSNTIVLLQQNVRVDFWKGDEQETHQHVGLATMLVFAPGRGNNAGGSKRSEFTGTATEEKRDTQ